jgi:molybdopterin-guanine dinucleotide biosynthesis protein A
MTSAAILAGGRARRFGGADKTQLRIDGRTILDRQVSALRGRVDRLFLVGYRGTAVVPPSLERLADRVADQGPLGGLDAALEAAGTGPVLLVACDMPWVDGPFGAYLLALTAEADAVVPRTERGYHPLYAAYTQACRAAVARRLRHGQRRMIDLLHDVRVRVVEPEEVVVFGDGNRLFANVNSQAELDAIESQLSH